MTLNIWNAGWEITRRLSNDDDDASASRDTTAQLVNTLYINIFLFLVLGGLFELLRRNRSIYLNRYVKRFIDTNRVPEPPSLTPLGWVQKILSVPEHQVLEMVGLDGYMCIRFIVVCFRTACFCSFWSLLILVPVYGTATNSAGKDGWDKFTIANIPEDITATRLWAPVFMCYIFSGFFCQLMYVEYKNFIGKRVEYLVNGDSDTPVQTYYTVMVERVPNSLKSAPMLAGFFERLFPGEFHSAEVAMDLFELETVTSKRKRVRDKLEKSIAVCWAVNERPVVWKRPSLLPDFPIPVVQNKFAQRLGYEVVDSIDYYTKELQLLNEKVVNMQRTHFDQRQRLHELEELRLVQIKRRLEDHTIGALHNVGSRFAEILMGDSEKADEALLGAVESDEEETLSKLKDKRRNSFLAKVMGSSGSAKSPIRPDTSAHSEDTANDRTAATANDKTPIVRSTTENENRSESNNTTVISRRGSRKSRDNSAENSRQNREGIKSAGTRFALQGVEGIAKEGVKTAEFAAKGALRGVLEATRALELLTFGAQYRVSSTAFVTFKSRVAKCACHQMLLSHEYYSMEVVPAPNPTDIVWENVSIPQSQIKIRKGIADGTLVVGALFWSLVVTFISAISNLESISRVIPSLQQYSNTDLYQFANNYLAIGLLLILLAILPFIFDFIARNYEGLKTESEIQNSIMTRYFYYQLANVYVSVGLGSVATSLHEILANPASILSILGSSLPSFSIFFANLVIIKTFTAVPIEMLRVFPVLDILSVSLCMDKRRCTRRDLRTGAFADPPMLYGWIYPNLMMILMIMLTYNCIAPFLMPICAFFFGLAYLMYKYQLLYVYINSYQSGGFMWYAVFNRSMVALIAGVCTLLCYLAIRMTFISGPFYLLLPLPVLIAFFWRHCDKRIRSPATTLSLEGAMELDEEVRAAAARGERTPHEQFSDTRFRQPALKEGKLKPALYRKGKPMLPEGIHGSRPEFASRYSIGGGSAHTLSPRSTTDRERNGGGDQDLEAQLSSGASDHGLDSDSKSGSKSGSGSTISPIHTRSGPGASANTSAGIQSPLSTELGFIPEGEQEDGDEFDAEDGEKDVDNAVNELLEDENSSSRAAVNVVSEQIGAIRRSSLMGVGNNPSSSFSDRDKERRVSSGDASPEEGRSVKLHTFTSKDLESGSQSDTEEKKDSSKYGTTGHTKTNLK